MFYFQTEQDLSRIEYEQLWFHISLVDELIDGWTSEENLLSSR